MHSDANVRSSRLARVRFLVRHDEHPEAAAWWDAVSEYPGGAPGIIRELLRTSRSVVCGDLEAEQALAWARAHPAWTDDEPALIADETT